jgi:hypothetical protein
MDGRTSLKRAKNDTVRGLILKACWEDNFLKLFPKIFNSGDTQAYIVWQHFQLISFFDTVSFYNTWNLYSRVR